MESVGDKYYRLCEHFPLRPIESAEDFLYAEDLCEALRVQLIEFQLHADEIAYLETLEILCEDYELNESGTDLDDEDEEPESPEDELLSCEEEFSDWLVEKREDMQEWDFVQLCNTINTVISINLQELS